MEKSAEVDQQRHFSKYEQTEALLPDTYIVVRIDGRTFTSFTNEHNFQHPNDPRGIGLMNEAAKSVMHLFPDIVIAFGQSDEYSFVFCKSTTTFSRQKDKILTSKHDKDREVS